MVFFIISNIILESVLMGRFKYDNAYIRISPLSLWIWSTNPQDEWSRSLQNILQVPLSSDGVSYEKFHAHWLVLWGNISTKPPSFFEKLSPKAVEGKKKRINYLHLIFFSL